ncbi:MAG: tetratricopeptide repeat protein [Pedobacter sp.]|uniref:tetratricopeptide repeat protein n=1 Tax=Pedobacter sp. TaxID=1411316 RepID=UPI00356A7401
MNADTFVRKLMLSLVFVLLPYYLIAGIFETEKKTDQKVIEDITKQYSLAKTNTELKISLQKVFFELKDEESKSAEIITNVFIAKKKADELDQLNPTSTNLFKKALLNARQLKREDLEIWISLQYGFYLYTYRKYEESFPLFMYCIEALDQTAAEYIIQPYDTYKKTAYFLTTAGDYEKSNDYLQLARKYVKPNSSDWASITDALGLNSIHLDDLVKAEKYFKEALVIAEVNKDELRYAKVLGNLAEIKIKQRDYDTAIELLNQDIAISKMLSATQNTIYALVMLGKAYLGKGDVADANSRLQLAQHYAQSKTYFKSSEYEINLLILAIAERTGNYKEELIVRRKLEKLKNLLNGKDGREAIMKLGWETEKNKLKLKVQAETVKRQIESYLKIAALVSCAMLLAAIIFIIRAYRKKIKFKKNEYEEKIIEKHKQIEKLEFEIDKVRQPSLQNLETYTLEMQTLLNSHLMSTESWLNFKRYFIQTYSVYYESLIQNFPELTDAQLRIIFLTKLEMDNGGTARILGLTVDAVKKAKQRLRRRYGKDYDLLFEQK